MPDTQQQAELPRDLSRATLLAENRALRRNIDTMLRTQIEIATSVGVLASHIMRQPWPLRLLAWFSRLLSRLWRALRRQAKPRA